jgi:hypothetical protein
MSLKYMCVLFKLLTFCTLALHFFLEDPINGDQIRRESRNLAGFDAAYTYEQN